MRWTKRNNCKSIIQESFLDLNLFLESEKIKGNRLLLLNIQETLRKQAYVLLIGGEEGWRVSTFNSPFRQGKLSLALCTREAKSYLSGAISLAWLRKHAIIPSESNVPNGELPLN